MLQALSPIFDAESFAVALSGNLLDAYPATGHDGRYSSVLPTHVLTHGLPLPRLLLIKTRVLG